MAVDPHLATERLNYIGVSAVPPVKPGPPYFAPALDPDAGAVVRHRALEQLQPGAPTVTIAYNAQYQTSGYDLGQLHGKLGVYATVKNPVTIDFGASFPLVNPKTKLNSLSATVGLTGIDESSLKNVPAQLDFDKLLDLDANIFGGIRLKDVVKSLIPGNVRGQGAGADLPALTMIAKTQP